MAIITGTSGNDNLLGTVADDLIDALAGNDTIDGGGGSDAINAGDGDDEIRAGAGNETIDGGAGYDELNYAAASAAVVFNFSTGLATGGSGNDQFTGIEIVFGSAFNDILIGNSADNDFVGGAGNDSITGGGGLDWVGYLGASAGVNVNLATGLATGGAGNDTLSGIDGVFGSSFDDTLIGSGADEFFEGSGGNDNINGAGGFDIVSYSDAGGGVSVNLAAGNASGADGNDTLTGIEGVIGSGFNDTLNGSAGNDFLEGGDGIDWLTGGAGVDSYDGGAGNDVVFFEDGVVGAVVNLATGVIGNDGFGNAETALNVENVHGTWFADQIQLSFGYTFARAGNDTIVGGSGNNLIFAGSGSDSIDGGLGGDTVNYFDDGVDAAGVSVTGVTVNLATGVATDNWGGTDTLVNIENVTGSAFGDSITGNAQANFLDGGGGNDSFTGGDAEDSMRGGAGNDTLDGGVNPNPAFPFDYAYYDDATSGVTVNLVTGTATGGGVGTDTLISIEAVVGSQYNDSITGTAGENYFFGGQGDDTIDGGAGSDQVNYSGATSAVTVNLALGTATGGSGTDVILNMEIVTGGNFSDTLTGNDANNRLRGRAGNDTIDGGNGIDRAEYDQASGAVQVSLVTNTSSGADGVDTLISIENLRGSNFADTLTGNSGANLFQSRGGNDTVFGGAGNDTLDGEDGDDLMFGEAGQDSFSGSAGNDTMDGGAILDRITLSDLNSISYSGAVAAINLNLQAGTALDGFGGTDVLSNINFVTGSSFNDTITGSTTLIFEQIDGGAGNDTLDGGLITDTLNQDNNNRVSYQNAASAVNVNFATGTASGGGGNDTLANFTHVRGSAFNDTLVGSDSTLNQQFEGRAGNDTIDGAGGFDVARYDNAAAGANVNLVTGVASDGNGGTDTLLNIEGITGSAFNDTLTGGNVSNGTGSSDGLERFRGNAGNDTIDGGGGYDRSNYDSSTAAVNVTLGGTANGTASDGFGGTDTLISIEGVLGSTFNDTLTGSDSGIFESFEGREGNDTIDGNGGIDRADYNFSRAGVTVNLTSGTASDGEGGTDTLADIENVRGSRDFNDIITGNAAANLLEGQGGDDTLSGGAGNDTLDGGAGNDSIDGGTGTDGASYASAASSVTISLAIAGAQVTGGAGSDTLVSIEDLTGSSFNDTLTGNAGANTLDGGAGADSLVGGDGNDTYVVDDAGDVVVESSTTGGTDLVNASVDHTLANNVENLRVTAAGAINGTGNALSNVLFAGAGNNVLDGLGGTDTASYLYAASGVTVSLATVGVQATGGSGLDTLVNIESLRGSDFNDSLTGNAGANVLDGGLGNDVLNGSSGFDTASYALASGAVTVSLAIAGAQATGSAGSDALSNIEYLRGSSFNDSLTGNAGVNQLDGGAGNDVLDGGAGVDTASYATASAAVAVSLAIAGAQATGGSGSDTLIGIESLLGSGFNDTLTGNASVNVLDGGAGNDVLDGAGGVDTVSYATTSAAVTVSLAIAGAQATGGSGSDTLVNIESLRGSNFNDTLTGNASNNTLDGGAGNDVLDGGTGFDYASYVSAAGGVTVSLAIAGAQATGGAGSDTLSNIEYLRGSSFNDSLTGNAGNNILDGGAGSDTLDGGAGTDTAFYATAVAAVNVSLAIVGAQSTSGSGSDTLTNIENLTGSAFNDTLTGNSAANTLTGGGGADTFVLNSILASDTITDFVSGVDRLRISQAGIAVGDGDLLVENAATIGGSGGFATSAELVVVTGNIAGAITAANAAAAIGSATGAYSIGQRALFVVDNGVSSAAYLFTAADANALISDTELTLLATLSTTPSTGTGDLLFGP